MHWTVQCGSSSYQLSWNQRPNGMWGYKGKVMNIEVSKDKG